MTSHRCDKIYLLRLLLRRASPVGFIFTDRIASMSVTTRMTALLTRSNPIRPGIVGTARVDRDIDRLLRRGWARGNARFRRPFLGRVSGHALGVGQSERGR